MRALPAPTISTAWCAIISCADQPNQADIQVNLLLARAIARRKATKSRAGCGRHLDKIAAPFGARIKVAEVPPGPPVLETLVAEVYGPDYKGQTQLAAKIKKIFQQTPGVVDVDWYVEDPQTKYDMNVDLDKAALHGVSAADVTRTVQIGLGGASAGLLHDPASREDIPIEVRLSRPDRSSIEDLGESQTARRLRSGQVSLREVTNVQQDHHRSEHLSQEFAARRLRHRRRGGRDRKPGLRHSQDERRDRQNSNARTATA